MVRQFADDPITPQIGLTDNEMTSTACTALREVQGVVTVITEVAEL